jgi:three-Cys-motif partner protein
LLILDHVIATPALRDALELVFNDQNVEFIAELQRHVEETPGVELLRYKPRFRNFNMDGEAVVLVRKNNVPAFFFADPWGYRGVSLDLIEAALSHWGSDFLFFFNYNRINMNLGCEAMNAPINEFFRREHAEELRETVARLRPKEREEAVLKAMHTGVKELGAKVEKFTYRSKTGARTTHHLMYVSRHRLGMSLFKEISAKESTSFEDDVPSLEHNPAGKNGQGMLFSPLGQLEMDLKETFAGMSLTTEQIYHQHHNGKPYILKNYRQAVLNLKDAGVVSVDPLWESRASKESLPMSALITFKAS